MYLLIFIAIILTGLLIQSIFFPKANNLLKFSIIWIFGCFITISSLYFLVMILSGNMYAASILYGIILIILSYKAKIYPKTPQVIIDSFFSKTSLIVLASFLFAYYLFSRSFSYDLKTHDFLIASNIYQDFGAHIAFIRSFSLGENIPFEVPFFAGTGLLYHFMFYFFAGILEYFGMRIDVALNFISAVSFITIFFLIIELAKEIFKSVQVGILACILLLFNGSLSFFLFFKDHAINVTLPLTIWRNNSYIVNKSLLGENVQVFWNLNTYVNQRHLIFGVAFVLLWIYIFISFGKGKALSKKHIAILGILSGFFTFWHALMYVALIITLTVFTVLQKKERLYLLTFILATFLTAIPLLIMIKLHSLNGIALHLGFLSNQQTIVSILKFWLVNIGFLFIPLILVLFFLNSYQKKIYFCFMMLFFVPNVLNFSTRFLYDNHKFFNLWIILLDIFASYFFITLFKKNLFLKVVTIILIAACTLSGFIDFFVIKNDVLARIHDFKYTNTYSWIDHNTHPSDVFLTSGEIYDPLSLVGRKTILGREYYIYVYGADPSPRMDLVQKTLQGETSKEQLYKYIVLYKRSDVKNNKLYNKVRLDLEYKKLYEDDTAVIYKI